MVGATERWLVPCAIGWWHIRTIFSAKVVAWLTEHASDPRAHQSSRQRSPRLPRSPMAAMHETASRALWTDPGCSGVGGARPKFIQAANHLANRNRASQARSDVKTTAPTWVLFFVLLTIFFVSSAARAADTGNLREQPPRHGVIAMTSIASEATERVVELHLSSGQRQRVLYLSLLSPRATIVMLPGGTGNIGLTRDGDVRRDDNFVVRTRDMWAAKGYAVVIPDTIDRASLRGLRSSSSYALVVEALVQFAHAQASAPVFLLGTSQGSIAAANGAAHAHPGTLGGVVLTESVSRLGGSHETVFDAGLQDIRIPALVVANHNDRCNVAPPQDAPEIAAGMSHSPDVRVVEVSGGTDASSNACGSLTPHGYYGIEAQVVGTINDWIRDRLR
jgi:hypothetical protein